MPVLDPKWPCGFQHLFSPFFQRCLSPVILIFHSHSTMFLSRIHVFLASKKAFEHITQKIIGQSTQRHKN